MITDQGRKVADHWSRVAVGFEGALASLRRRGIVPEHAEAGDLHEVDMIHMGGVAATDALAEMAEIGAGQKVLDVGSGVGGPARRLADRFGAVVSGIELSEALHRTSVRLTDLVGLGGTVTLVNGSALSLPFGDGAFDAVVMQHVAMQIAEKDRLFAELARVVRPGGCLALHEIFAGRGEIHYPLPWATEPGMSALETLDTCAERLHGLGFAQGDFADGSEEGRRFHRASIATFDTALTAGTGAIGLSVEATKTRRAASAAMERNLGSGSVRVGMIVARKIGPGSPPP